jgi:hypothetical protein
MLSPVSDQAAIAIFMRRITPAEGDVSGPEPPRSPPSSGAALVLGCSWCASQKYCSLGPSGRRKLRVMDVVMNTANTESVLYSLRVKTNLWKGQGEVLNERWCFAGESLSSVLCGILRVCNKGACMGGC